MSHTHTTKKSMPYCSSSQQSRQVEGMEETLKRVAQVIPSLSINTSFSETGLIQTGNSTALHAPYMGLGMNVKNRTS